MVDILVQLLIMIFFIYKASYLDEKENCTEPAPSVRVPRRHWGT